MATIESRNIVKTILENDGVYPGDPQLFAVYSYIHAMTGNKLYSICMSVEASNEIYDSPYCKDIRLLWSRAICGGLTGEGKVFLNEKS
jgi:hypothetical protein